MLRIHRILIGERAGQYLPLAEAKLRWYAGRWDGRRVNQVIRNDDARIQIQLWGPEDGRVIIQAGVLAYEFFSSEQEEASSIGAFAEGSFSEALTRRPITSTALAKPGAEPAEPDWTVSDMPQAMRTHPTINRQRNPQYTWHGKHGMVQAPLAVHATGNNFDGRRIFRGLFTTNDEGQQVELDAYFTYDVGFDVAPTFYGPEQALPLLPLVKAPLWWRRAAVLRAGGRRFMVATDAHSNFYAYPLKADGVGTTLINGGYAVPPAGFRMVAAADYLPSWVALPTVASMRPIPQALQYPRDGEGTILFNMVTVSPSYEPPTIDYSAFPGEEDGWTREDMLQDNHYVWAFNGDCSRAAAVVQGDELPRVASETSTNPTTGATENRDVPYKHLRRYSPSVRVPYWTELLKADEIAAVGGLREVSATTRGVVEVDIAIEVTGEGDMDFTFTVSPRAEFRDRCFVDADYAYGDPRLQALGLARDDLLVATVERHMHHLVTETWTPEVSGDTGEFVKVRNHLTVRKAATMDPVKGWSLSEHVMELTTVRPGSTYFGNFGTTHAPYGIYEALEYDRCLEYRDVTLSAIYARCSVLALDLRSLSAVIECEEYPHPLAFDQLTEYGVNTGIATYFFGAKVDDPYPALTERLDAPPPEDTVMPCTYKGTPGAEATAGHCSWLDLYRIDLDALLGETQHGRAIASHPAGHAAFALVRSNGTPPATLRSMQAIDLIHRRVGQATRASTHLEAFNEAWATGRAYSDYAIGGSLYPGRLQGYAVWRDVSAKKLTGFSYG